MQYHCFKNFWFIFVDFKLTKFNSSNDILMKGPRSFKAIYTSLKVIASMKFIFLPHSTSMQLISDDFDALNAKVNSFYLSYVRGTYVSTKSYLKREIRKESCCSLRQWMKLFTDCTQFSNSWLNRLLPSNIAVYVWKKTKAWLIFQGKK